MAKLWKKIGFLILIIACLFNIVLKLTTRVSVSDELSASADYVKKIIVQDNAENQVKN